MDWRPDPAALAHDSAGLIDRTMRTLTRRLPDPPAATRLALRALLASGGRPGADNLLHPLFFQWAYAVDDALAAGRAAADEVAARLPEVAAAIAASRDRARAAEAALGLPIDVEGDEAALPLTLARMRAMARAASGADATIRLIARPDDAVRANLGAAIALIARAWPAMHAELRATTQAFYFFEGDTAIGASDIRFHGGIFLKVEHTADPVRLAEEMIHEASHTRLNAALANRVMFTNDPADRYQTPLRPDARPMFGLFHQMFVLCRLAEYYRRLPADVARPELNVARIGKQLRGSVATVGEHARLTPLGAELYRAIAGSVELGAAA